MDKIKAQVADYSKQAEQVVNRLWGHCKFNTISSAAEDLIICRVVYAYFPFCRECCLIGSHGFFSYCSMTEFRNGSECETVICLCGE